ncbi:NAD(P)-binding protein [SAR86 cluster bacterium]|nr:NAD(P)-binding protein [SAR86 cluster bacterium]MDC3144733.1 NAD(P)-binding protein [SAR86 cluster bacterium]
MRIAIIGSGIGGLSAAYFLGKNNEVTIFEKSDRLGGHTHTHQLELETTIKVDSGFIVLNDKNYKNLMEFFNEIEIDLYETEMSFSVNSKFLIWNSKEFFNFSFLKNLKKIKLLIDIMKFNYLAKNFKNKESIGMWLKTYNFSNLFIESYLLPMTSAIWSSTSKGIANYPAESMNSFLNNHGLLNLYNRPQWYSVLGGSNTYIEKLLDLKIFDVKLNSKVKINRSDNKIFISNKDESEEYDLLIMANHPNQIEECIEDLSEREKQAMDLIKYQKNTTILHGDESLMPKNKNHWCSWNVYKDENYEYVTYWMNNLQKISTSKNIFVTLGDFPKPNLIFNEMQYEHPVFDFKALEGQKAFEKIQSEKNTYYTGAYLGYGFHEDGIKSSQAICKLINDINI